MDQDDHSLVFWTPFSISPGNAEPMDLPMIFSFKLEEGKLIPSSSEYKFTNVVEVLAVYGFEIFADKVLYAQVLTKQGKNSVVFNCDKKLKISTG